MYILCNSWRNLFVKRHSVIVFILTFFKNTTINETLMYFLNIYLFSLDIILTFSDNVKMAEAASSYNQENCIFYYAHAQLIIFCVLALRCRRRRLFVRSLLPSHGRRNILISRLEKHAATSTQTVVSNPTTSQQPDDTRSSLLSEDQLAQI